MYSVVANPENIFLAQELAKRSRAEAWHHHMRTVAYGTAGLGALLICSAVAWAIYANGTSRAVKQLADAGVSLRRTIDEAGKSLGREIREAFNTPIHGSVKMPEPGTVLVRQDAPLNANVTVHQDKPFVLEDKPLTVKGEIKATIPPLTEAQLATTTQPASRAKVMTYVTKFYTVAFPPGSVVTGWRFDDSTQDRPSHQYCYYTQTLEENAEAQLDIGFDGKFTRPKRVPKGINLSAAFQNCVWAQ